MITLADIRKVISISLKSKFDAKVYFDNVEQTADNHKYFYIEFTPKAKTIDDIYTQYSIMVDISYVIPEDKNGKVDRRVLQDSIGIIDQLFRPVFYVRDRAFTVLEVNNNIVDDILNVKFELDFVDSYEYKNIYKFMETLNMNWR